MTPRTQAAAPSLGAQPARNGSVRAHPRRVIPASWPVLKRVVDVSLGGAALFVLSPVLLLAALSVSVVSPGPPLFLQERVGEAGRRFRLWKLRTMMNGAESLHSAMQELNEVEGPVFKIRNDPRLHALGKFLRRTSIDELPNLINVLLGEMSLVGPRPPLPSEVAHYDETAKRRLTVKPGVTCLWQISGRSNVSFDEWMQLDNQYIDTWSPLGDLVILLRTIPAVIRGEGAR